MQFQNALESKNLQNQKNQKNLLQEAICFIGLVSSRLPPALL